MREGSQTTIYLLINLGMRAGRRGEYDRLPQVVLTRLNPWRCRKGKTSHSPSSTLDQIEIHTMPEFIDNQSHSEAQIGKDEAILWTNLA